MARKKIIENKSIEDDEMGSAIESDEEIDSTLADEEQQEEVELSDIPIEQFLKDPKMSMITDETEIEETTAWCPVCNDYTIFVDKTCTVCGFVKGSKKAKNKEEDEEESTESTFDLVPSDEVIDEMNIYGGYDDVDGERNDY